MQTSHSLSNQSHAGHLFYIPVMGTGFTIDTPLRVARFGISSVVSLVDDLLIERIHRYHAQQEGKSYTAIASAQPDPRAARITAYLNFLNKLIRKQIETMKSAPFEAGGETSRYFELLPDGVLKRRYQEMSRATDPGEKQRLQAMLRDAIQPGSINVNIMTKLDAIRYRRGAPLPPEFSDAIAALRGYAQSDLDSAIVFSAGMNQRLYAYASEFPDFLPNAEGRLKKRIILKVSDFRSASIQGRYLAKRGLWISEFRIESGLNCGGHAFPCGGQLMGPILEEFKEKRQELAQSLWKTCVEFWQGKGIPVPATALSLRVTVQGGVGTAAEHDMLLTRYGVDATGWGTPFLLAPDVTAVDDDLLERLTTCGPGDVYLSDSSPIGVPFWNLRTSPSEEARRKRLDEGKPGSPCPKGFLRFDKSFTQAPLCLASQEYQEQQLSALREKGADVTLEEIDHVTAKSCICHELGGSALRRYGIDANVPPAVCPGPNIVYFHRRTNLREMVDHIYGRLSLIDEDARPHMFVNELAVNLDYLKRWIVPAAHKGGPPAQKIFREFAQNLLSGIQYYREKIAQFAPPHPDRFLEQLKSLEAEVRNVLEQEKIPPTSLLIRGAVTVGQ